MQDELRPGDFFCEPEFPEVICHDYAKGLVSVGLRGSFEHGDGRVKRAKGESSVAAATRKLKEMSQKAAAAAATSPSAPKSADMPTARELKDLAGPSEELLPDVRDRMQTTLFEPMEELRVWAMGGRKAKRPAGECCDAPCCKEARAERDKARAERATWQERAETAAAELRELKAEMCGRVEALEEELQPGAAALQQAAIRLLDGREERRSASCVCASCQATYSRAS